MVTDIQGRALNVKYIESVGETKKEIEFRGNIARTNFSKCGDVL